MLSFFSVYTASCLSEVNSNFILVSFVQKLTRIQYCGFWVIHNYNGDDDDNDNIIASV